MYREIRSERLSVKVNAARIRQAASWLGHAKREGGGGGMRNRERERERDVARTAKREAKGAVGA